MTDQPTSPIADTPTRDVPMLRIPRSADPVPTEPRLQSRHVPVWAYLLVVVVVVAGTVVAARSMGWFVTSGRGTVLAGSGPGAGRTAAAVPAPAASVAPGSSAAAASPRATPTHTGTGPGAGAGTEAKVAPTAGADPADVKGWMSVQQVLDAFPVTKEALYAKFGIPASTPTDTTLSGLKEVEGVGEFDVPGLRTWLGEQAG